MASPAPSLAEQRKNLEAQRTIAQSELTFKEIQLDAHDNVSKIRRKMIKNAGEIFPLDADLLGAWIEAEKALANAEHNSLELEVRKAEGAVAYLTELIKSLPESELVLSRNITSR